MPLVVRIAAARHRGKSRTRSWIVRQRRRARM